MSSRYKTKKGKSKDLYTILRYEVVDTDAWRSLSRTAQALYPILRMEWKGSKANNNGSLSLSSRQAAQIMGVAKAETITTAFKDLQAKGFVIVHKNACLGTEGEGRSFEFELTELDMPGKNEKSRSKKLYLEWHPSKDFEVINGVANNPNGKGGNLKSHPENRDGPIPKNGTNIAILSQKRGCPIPKNGTN